MEPAKSKELSIDIQVASKTTPQVNFGQVSGKNAKLPYYLAKKLHFIDPSISFAPSFPGRVSKQENVVYVNMTHLFNNAIFAQHQSIFDSSDLESEMSRVHNVINDEFSNAVAEYTKWMDLINFIPSSKARSLRDLVGQLPVEVLGLAAYLKQQQGRGRSKDQIDEYCLFMAERFYARNNLEQTQAINKKFEAMLGEKAIKEFDQINIDRFEGFTKGDYATALVEEMINSPQNDRELVFEKIDELKLLDQLTDEEVSSLFETNLLFRSEDRYELRKLLAKREPRQLVIYSDISFNEMCAFREIAYVNGQDLLRTADEKFNYCLSLKSFALFAGDSFIDEMEEDNKAYEGARPSDCLNFIIPSLNHFKDTTKRDISVETKAKISEATEQLRYACKFAEKIENIEKKAVKTSLEAELISLSQELHNHLKDKKSLLLPLGWWDDGSGHSILAEVKLTPDGKHYDMYVYNGGEGVSYHGMNNATRRRGATVKAYKIPVGDFGTEFIRRMLEPAIGPVKGKEYKPLDFYSFLHQYNMPVDPTLANWMKLQFSGTCSMRCLLAYLHAKLGSEDYDQFKRFIKHEGVTGLIDKFGFDLSTQGSKILGFTFQDLLHHFQKEIQAGTTTPGKMLEWIKRLNELGESKLKLQENIKEASKKTYPKNLRSIEKITPNSMVEAPLETLTDFSFKNSADNQLLTNAIPRSILDAKSFVEITDILSNSEYLRGTHIDYLENVVRELTQLLKMPRFQQMCDNADVETLRKLINLLSLNLSKSFEVVKMNSKLTPLQATTANLACHICYQLIIKIENKTQATQSISQWGIEIHQQSDNSLFTDSETISNLSKLTSSEGSKLFNFNNYYSGLKDPPLRLPEAEVKYFLGSLDEQTKVQVEEAYNRMQEITLFKVNKDKWMATYALTHHLLPSYIMDLYHLAIQARLAVVGITPWTFASLLLREPQRGLQVIEPSMSNQYQSDVGFYTNETKKYHWLDALLIVPDHYNKKVTPDYHPTGTYDAKLAQIERDFTDNKSAYFAHPIRTDKINHDSHYFVHFDDDSANLMIKLKRLSGFNSYLFLIEAIENIGDHILEPEFQIVISNKITQASMDLLNDMKMDPERGYTYLDEFFKKMFAKIDAQLTINPYNASCLRTLCLITEWQTRISNLLIAAESNRSFKAEIEQRLEALSKNPLVKSNKQFQGYLAQIKAISNTYIQDPTDVKTLILAVFEAKKINEDRGDLDIASPYLFLMSQDIYTKYLSKISEFLSVTPDGKLNPHANECMTEILAKSGVKIDSIPIYHRENNHLRIQVGDNTYTFDIRGKQLYLQGLALQADLEKNQFYTSVFGDRDLTHIRGKLIGNEQHIWARDGHEEVYFNVGSSVVMKRLDASIFGYTTPINVKLINTRANYPDLVFGDALRWGCGEGPNAKIFYTDRNTNKLIAELSYDGIKLSDYPEKLFLAKYSFLKKFNRNSCLLVEKNAVDKPVILLTLPGFKEDGKEITFEYQEDSQGNGRWINRNDPKQWISADQFSDANGDDVLILENTKGERRALIPKKTISVGLSTQLSHEPVETTEVISFPIVDNQLQTNQIDQTLFLTYQTLQNAKLPDDYQRALNYLQGIVHFAQFTPEQYKLLAWIIFSLTESKDHSVYATSVRLYALWLVKSNQVRWGGIKPDGVHDADQVLNLNSSGKFFRSYLNTQSIIQKIEKKLLVEYARKKSNLPKTMRMENILSTQEMTLLNEHQEQPVRIEPQFIPMLINPELLKKIKTVPDLVRLREYILHPKAMAKELKMHPSTEELCSHFYELYRKASSDDPVKLKEVERVLQMMINDDNLENTFLRLVLHKAMQGFREMNDYLLDHEMDDFKSFPEAFANFISKNIHTYSVASSLIYLSPQKKVNSPHVEPPPSASLAFSAYRMEETGSLNRLQELYHEHFRNARPKIVKEIDRFEVKDGRDYIQKGISEVNDDLVVGAQKNGNIPKYEFKGNLPELKSDVEIEKGLLEGELDLLEKVILRFANATVLKREEIIQLEVKKQLGEMEPISMNDLKILFMKGDVSDYKIRLGDLNVSDIKKLDGLIGQYLLMSRRVDHMDQILSDINAGSLQKSAQKLSMKLNYNPDQNTRAFMVFEEAMGIYLRKDQIEDLKKLYPKDAPIDNVILQRIQGAGKSLVFGHLLALLKADGTHLSVHVAPTSQYATAIYDMERTSNRIFRQKEKVLEFTESPHHDTQTYLNHFYHTLKDAIPNKEYVTVTKETLLALRDKYIKCRESIDQCGEGSLLWRMNLIKIHLLKNILKLLRTQAIFTFDEAHLAFDPYKELNMPIGTVSKIPYSEMNLVREIILLSKENSNDEIVKKLLANSEIRKSFGITESAQSIPVANYINGQTDELPAFLYELHDKKSTAGELVVMARQMLFKGLIKELEAKKINQEHGFPSNVNDPKVSVPYVANMVPALNSEFSNRLIMMVNTFLLYRELGIKPEQTKLFIEFLREQAAEQFLAISRQNLNADVADTEMVKFGMAKFGDDIRALDLEDPSKLKTLHAIIQQDPVFKPLIMKFVQSKVLSTIDVYGNQVTANGQNAASMAKAFVSYTASLQNKNMAPPNTRIETDVGTNGQTIDLFLKKRMACIEMPRDPISLIKKIKDNPNLSAIIDPGCFFRGLTNLEVARMIVSELEPPKKGVMFFDNEGNLNLLRSDKADPIKLSGTTPEIIAQETGLTLKQLFTYYDQGHITGIDILQHAEANAFVTCADNTQLQQLLQGGRRLRDLENTQNLTFVIDSTGATEARRKLILDPKTPLDVKNLIAFATINEIESGRNQNLLFCMQKLENSLQQIVLDHLYEISDYEEEDSKEYYAKIRGLFVKTSLVDYVKAYATKTKEIGIEEFLDQYLQYLLSNTNGALSESELSTYLTEAKQIITQAIKELQPMITIAEGRSVNPEAAIEHLTNRSQIRQQEAHVVQDNLTILQNAGPKKTGCIDKESNYQFYGDFNIYKATTDMEAHSNWHYQLGSILQLEIGTDYDHLFDDRIGFASSVINIYKNEPSFITSPKQTAFYAIYKCGELDWNLIAFSGSELDTVKEKYGKDKGTPGVIVTAGGKILTAPNRVDDIKHFNESNELKTLLVQAMFARGEFESLEKPELFAVFKDWVIDPQRKENVIKFFNDHIKGKHKGNEETKVFKLLIA